MKLTQGLGNCWRDAKFRVVKMHLNKQLCRSVWSFFHFKDFVEYPLLSELLIGLKPNNVYSYDFVGRRSGWNCCWCDFVSPRHSEDKAAVSRRFCQSWWLQRNIFRDCFCRKWFSSCRWCIYDSFSWTLSFWPFNSHKWLRQNYSFQYGYNIKQEWWE